MTRFDADRGGSVEAVWIGDALRVRVESLGLGAVSVTLRNGELDRFKRFIQREEEESE